MRTKQIFQKMLPILLKMRFQVYCCRIYRSVSLQNGFGNMLFDLLLQPLESMTHIPTIAVAQEVVHDISMMKSR